MGTAAWADVEFKGTTSGSFNPDGAQGPLQFLSGAFDIVMPPSNGFLNNLGTFEIDKSALTCPGNNCYVENWNLDPVTFTLTLTFTLPTLGGTAEFQAPISGTIKKNGNSSNFTVDDVTIDFDNTPQNFTYFDELTGHTGSFDLTVFDPAAMDLTLNPSHNSVTTGVTGQITNVMESSVTVPDTATLGFLDLLALPGLLLLRRHRG